MPTATSISPSTATFEESFIASGRCGTPARLCARLRLLEPESKENEEKLSALRSLASEGSPRSIGARGPAGRGTTARGLHGRLGRRAAKRQEQFWRQMTETEYRLSPLAEQDIETILEWTPRNSGKGASPIRGAVDIGHHGVPRPPSVWVATTARRLLPRHGPTISAIVATVSRNPSGGCSGPGISSCTGQLTTAKSRSGGSSTMGWTSHVTSPLSIGLLTGTRAVWVE